MGYPDFMSVFIGRLFPSPVRSRYWLLFQFLPAHVPIHLKGQPLQDIRVHSISIIGQCAQRFVDSRKGINAPVNILEDSPSLSLASRDRALACLELTGNLPD